MSFQETREQVDRAVRGEDLDTFEATRGEVRRAVRRGDDLATINERVIEPAPLSDEEKSALWLYGWSAMSRGRQRYELNQSLRALHAARAVVAPGTD